MSNYLLLRASMLLALLWCNLPVTQAQSMPARAPARGAFIPFSMFRDDPFAAAAVIEQMDAANFSVNKDGRFVLQNNWAWVGNEPVVFNSIDFTKYEIEAFAWNPWPVPLANALGDFRFPAEARFPLFTPERGADGKIIRREGLQVWKPNDLHLGLNTAFVAVNAARAAAEAWAGREIAWGKDGQLLVRPHFFIAFQGFHSRFGRGLFFGIVPYRLPGETDVKMFETASSWDLTAHESGHALHFALKPNSQGDDAGFGAWSESFGDQTAMWSSLRDPARVQQLLAETRGDLNQPNALTHFVEAFAALVGTGTGIREAFNDKKVSDTDEEIHHRSEVLTGAAYKIFVRIYGELKSTLGPAAAVQQAGEIMGIFQVRATDFTPESVLTLEDVGQAYLKVDKEYFDSHYRRLLVDEFRRREIFDANSEANWLRHEAARPQLFLPTQASDAQIEQTIHANLDKLGLGPEFGLVLQSVAHANYTAGPARQTQTIVRVQLTDGRAPDAQRYDNYGILVFRANGMLADYHSPLPAAAAAGQASLLANDTFAQTQARMVLRQAAQFGLDRHGVPLTLLRNADGQWTVAARVPSNDGPFEWVDVFTPEHPEGERRLTTLLPVPPDQRIPNVVDINNE